MKAHGMCTYVPHPLRVSHAPLFNHQTTPPPFPPPHTTTPTAKPKEPITITLPDGSVKEGTAWVTTPYDIAAGIAQGLADSAVVAKVSNQQQHNKM